MYSRRYPPAVLAGNASKETSSVRGSIPDAEFAKDFMESIAAKYAISNKAETGKMMKSLMRMEYNGKGNVREYIMKGSNIVEKLKDLKMTVEEPFLVYMLLNSLPDEFDHLKSLYKTQKEQWTVNELISLCVEVEEEVKKKGKGKAVDVNLVTKAKHKRKFGGKKFKPGSSEGTSKSFKSDNDNVKNKPAGGMWCFFCKKPGHFKKDCDGFKAWLKKKGSFVLKSVFSLESNDFSIDNSWWFDTGSPIHIVNSLQGLSRISIPKRNETRVCTASGQRVAVKAVGIVKLRFKNGFVLELNNVYCIPSITRNLISGSQYVLNSGFSFSSINNKSIQFYYNSKYFGDAVLSQDYWRVNCSNISTAEKYNEIFFLNQSRSKRKFTDSSSFLWHKRLGHISRQRLMELVKQEILHVLNFDDFETCVDCLKGKMTDSSRKGSKRSEQMLDLIHTDICGPFPINTICGNCYYITFIDDFSRYCYVYLMSEK